MIIIYLTLILIIGYLVSRLADKDRSYLSHVVLFGLGIMGLFYFWNLLIWNKFNLIGFFIFYSASVFLLFLYLKSRKLKIIVPVNFNLIDFIIFAILFFVAYQQPYGYFDAWAFWNVKSIFLAFGDGNWQQVFSPYIQWTHPDYPLLLPSIVASGWVFSSTDNFFAPLIISVLFSWSIYLLLSEVLLILFNNKIYAFMGAICLFSIPAFLYWASSQYADVLVAAYLLLGIFLLFIGQKKHNFLLSGLAFGLLAFTKNEGLFYLVIFIISAASIYFYARKNISNQVIAFWFLGILPGLISSVIIKLLAPINEIFLIKINNLFFTIIQRIPIILKEFIKEFLLFKEWSYFWIIAFLILVIVVFLNFNKKDYWLSFFSIFIILSFLFFMIIYIFTPNDIIWHIETSFNRLLVQITPILVFFIFYFLKTIIKLQK